MHVGTTMEDSCEKDFSIVIVTRVTRMPNDDVERRYWLYQLVLVGSDSDEDTSRQKEALCCQLGVQ